MEFLIFWCLALVIALHGGEQVFFIHRVQGLLICCPSENGAGQICLGSTTGISDWSKFLWKVTKFQAISIF
jgi:hypothetical protein